MNRLAPTLLALATAGCAPSADDPDSCAGVFNYYKEFNGKMGFFGSSLDYVFDGVGDSLTDINGCGRCHGTDSNKSGRGNLNMKELRNPWTHWESGSTTTLGAAELIKRFEASFAARDYKRLLAPLFCTEQIHVATGRNNRVPASFLLTPRLGKGSSFNISVAAGGYNSLVEAIDQVVQGTDITDTRFAFAYLERSFDDINWVDQLIDRNIIDEQFARDVLAVDFTRSIFSNDRCDLLEFAPGQLDIEPDELGVEAVRAAFIDGLAGAEDGTPAGQLLAHLEASAAGDSFDHPAIARSFVGACADRDDNGDKIEVGTKGGTDTVSPFHADAMKLRSRDRQLVFERDGALDDADGSNERHHPVFEFARTLTTDTIRVTESAEAATRSRSTPRRGSTPSIAP